MSENKDLPVTRKDLSNDKERNRAIEEVLRDQARREVLRDVAYRQPGSSFRTRIAAALLATAALAAWVFPVPRLKPDIPFPIQPADELTGLRIATYIEAQQVEAFRQKSGRLPDVLIETGEPMPGMTYERLDARTYRLTGVTERQSLRWVSSDSLGTLWGDAGKRTAVIAR